MKIQLRRFLSIIVGGFVWVVFGFESGNPIDPAMCLVVGFIGAWVAEGGA